MKVSVDSDRCRGHGICLTVCPEVFDLTDDGYAEVRLDDIPAEFSEQVQAAIRSCPEHAIEAS